MAKEIFDESHYFVCSGGLKPARFNSGQEIMLKEDGNYYLTEHSLTCKGIDFSCRWAALIAAVIGAALVLLLSNPGGWVMLAALGAAIGGAGIGAIFGAALCGYKAAAVRKWIVYKDDSWIGDSRMVSNHKPVHLTCEHLFNETITFKPNVTNEFEALCLFGGNILMTGLEGFMYAYAFRGGKLLATKQFTTFFSNLGVNYLASLGVKGAVMRGVFAGYNAVNAYYMSNTKGGSKEDMINSALDGGLFIERAVIRLVTLDYKTQVYNPNTDKYEEKIDWKGFFSDAAMPLSMGGMPGRPGGNDAKSIDVKNKFNQVINDWKNPVKTINLEIRNAKEFAENFRDKLKSIIKGEGAHERVNLRQLAIEERAKLDLSNEGVQDGNIAVYEYIDTITGELVQEVFKTQEGSGKHAERIGWESLENKGIPNENVTRIYSELEPCELPSGGDKSCKGGGCKAGLNNKFPDAEITHSYDYPGSTKETRTAREAGKAERNTDFSRRSGKPVYPTNKEEE